jgi:hypothetical protein
MEILDGMQCYPLHMFQAILLMWRGHKKYQQMNIILVLM